MKTNRQSWHRTIVTIVFGIALALSSKAAGIDECVPNARNLQIAQKPATVSSGSSGIQISPISPIVTCGVSYLAEGGVPVDFSNPPVIASDVATLLAKHIAAGKAENWDALKSQFQTGDHIKVDEFLGDPKKLLAFRAAFVLESARILLVFERAGKLDVIVKKTLADQTVVYVRFVALCDQGRLWMSTGSGGEGFTLTMILGVHGIDGLEVSEPE